MSLRSFCLATAAILLPLMPSNVHAQDAASETPSPGKITGNKTLAPRPRSASRQVDATPETIIVTSSRRAEKIREVPESVSVITAKEIRGAAAQTVDQVLRYVPSVDLPSVNSATLHPTANSISMRGLSGTRALVLLDGIPLNDSYFGSVQWNRVPLENIQHIENTSTPYRDYPVGTVDQPNEHGLDLTAAQLFELDSVVQRMRGHMARTVLRDVTVWPQTP